MDRGKLWNSRFKQLWHDKTQTLYQIEKALGCSRKSLTRCAVIAGFPPHNGEYQGECSIYAEAVSARLQDRVKTKQNKRALWLNLLRQNPNASIKQLELLQKQLYSWMVHYDRIWLTQNRPVVRRRGRIVGHKHCLEDWTSRDREYSVMVKQAAAKTQIAGWSAYLDQRTSHLWCDVDCLYGTVWFLCIFDRFDPRPPSFALPQNELERYEMDGKAPSVDSTSFARMCGICDRLRKAKIGVDGRGMSKASNSCDQTPACKDGRRSHHHTQHQYKTRNQTIKIL